MLSEPSPALGLPIIGNPCTNSVRDVGLNLSFEGESLVVVGPNLDTASSTSRVVSTNSQRGGSIDNDTFFLEAFIVLLLELRLVTELSSHVKLFDVVSTEGLDELVVSVDISSK